jgi:hypothetical protein
MYPLLLPSICETSKRKARKSLRHEPTIYIPEVEIVQPTPVQPAAVKIVSESQRLYTARIQADRTTRRLERTTSGLFESLYAFVVSEQAHAEWTAYSARSVLRAHRPSALVPNRDDLAIQQARFASSSLRQPGQARTMFYTK